MMPFFVFADAVPDPTSFGWWLQNFGPMGLVVFFAGIGLWRVCLFLKPYVIAMLSGHISLMDALAKTQVDQSGMLHEVRKAQSDHGEKIDEIHRHVVPIRREDKTG